MEETSKLKLYKVEGSDGPSAYREAINKNAIALDSAATVGSGPLSSRPSAATTTLRFFYTEDTEAEILYFNDNGTWKPIAMGGDGSITTAMLANEAVTGPKLGEGTVRQEAGTTQGILSWGMISKTGGILGGTGDFTVTEFDNSTWQVTWNKEKSSEDYGVIVTGGGAETLVGVSSAFFAFTAGSISKTEFRIQCFEQGGSTTKALGPCMFMVVARS